MVARRPHPLPLLRRPIRLPEILGALAGLRAWLIGRHGPEGTFYTFELLEWNRGVTVSSFDVSASTPLCRPLTLTLPRRQSWNQTKPR